MGLFNDGFSIREISKKLGISKITVQKYKKIWFPRGRPQLCKCGQLVEHTGWCSYRVQKSEPRKKFLKSFGNHKKSTSNGCPRCNHALHLETEFTSLGNIYTTACTSCGYRGPILKDSRISIIKKEELCLSPE
jgi:hypothetical protein